LSNTETNGILLVAPKE